MPADFAMPTGSIISDIALTLLLPLALGMMILHYFRTASGWISTWSIRASMLGILMIIIGSSSAGRLDVDVFGGMNILLVCSFMAILGIACWIVTKLLRTSKPDRTAIEMEVIVRNVNLGVLIKASMFPAVVGGDNTVGDMVLFTVLLYGALQTIAAIAMVAITRRGSSIN
jgi:BASS family bile acid:Na+ symporter